MNGTLRTILTMLKVILIAKSLHTFLIWGNKFLQVELLDKLYIYMYVYTHTH